jgi:hypothetical protein
MVNLNWRSLYAEGTKHRERTENENFCLKTKQICFYDNPPVKWKTDPNFINLLKPTRNFTYHQV